MKVVESSPFGFVKLAVCLAFAAPFGLSWAEVSAVDTDSRPDRSETIVSDREEVDLVDDSNVSEAMERRPELQFNNVTIDGEVSQIALSDLPSEAVDSLEVLRAITPDMDASARGGSLNVESKPTYLLEKRSTKLEASVSYEELGEEWERNVSISDSRSFGDFGYRLGLSFEDASDGKDKINTDWQYLEDEGVFVPKDIRLSVEDSDSENLSFASRFDFRLAEELSVFARFDYTDEQLERYNPRSKFRFDVGEYVDPKSNSGSVVGARLERDSLGYNSKDIGRFWQLGAAGDLEKLHFDLKVSLQQNRYFEPNWFVVDFKQDDVDLEYEWTDPKQINVKLPSPSAAEDFEFDELLDERWRNDRDDAIVVFNLKRPFESNRLNGFIKAGLKYRAREREQTSDSHRHDSVIGDFSLDEVESDFHARLVNAPQFELGPFADVVRSRDYFFGNLDRFPINERRTREQSDGSSFLVNEDVSSGYGMASAEIGKFRGILGARYEKTDITFEASEVVVGKDGAYRETIPREGDNGYANFFPSAHLRYFWGDRTTLIGAWTKSIQRPDYGSIVPYRKINYSNASIDTGNPELKPTLYDNIDLSLDYKLSEASLLSLEFYSRDISDLVFWEVTRVSGGEFDGFELGRSQNGPSASKRGVNLIWNQMFEEWHSALSNWSMNVKASYLDSESEYPNRPDSSLPAVNSPKETVQVSLTYNDDKLYAQLLYKDTGESLTSVDDLVWRDLYDQGRTMLGLSTSYKASPSTRVFFEVGNILSNPGRNYYADTSRPTLEIFKSPSYETGVKMNF